MPSSQPSAGLAAPVSAEKLQRSRSVPTGWLLCLLLLWSLALRVWFASSGLDASRYWDERNCVRNVRSFLETGSVRPVNFRYPSLSYLPHGALLGAAQGAVRLAGAPDYSLFDGDRLRPEGYLLSRLLQVIFGIGTLWLTFLLGQRLASSRVGLMAALLLAVVPLHIRLSTVFKPDILLLLTTLLALWLSLDAVARPSFGRYLLVGVAIGLAVSSKLTGWTAALPIAVAAFFLGFRDRRHWAWLAAAGVMAAGVFLAFNPQLGAHVEAYQRHVELFAELGNVKTGTADAGFLGVLHQIGGLLLSNEFGGPVIGLVSLFGLAALVLITVWRRGADSLLVLLFLAYPLGYSVIFAAAAPYAKPNHLLPLLPFVALCAAWLLRIVWRWARQRLALLRRPASGVIVAVAFTLLLVHPAHRYAYRVVVPTTASLAVPFLWAQLDGLAGRGVFVESWPGGTVAPGGAKLLAVALVDLKDVDARRLDLADAEFFSEHRLEGESGAFYRERVSRVAPEEVHVFRPRPFKARGTPLVVILHPARRGDALDLQAHAVAPGRFHLSLPGTQDLASLELWVPQKSVPEEQPPRLIVAGRERLLFQARWKRQGVWISERFLVEGEVVPVEIEVPPEALEGETLKVRVHRWRQPGTPRS